MHGMRLRVGPIRFQGLKPSNVGRCAGATQRSVGITGDIARGPNEACGLGACAGKDADCFDSAPLRHNATSTTSGPAGWPWMCNAALVAFFLFVLQGTMLDD